MNDISLQNFRKEITLIQAYLKYIEYANNIVGYNFSTDTSEDIKSLLSAIKEQHIHFKIDKKIFEYKAVIISLYGLLENYIETWIKEYLENVSQLVNDYRKIDEIIRNNHFNFSLKLIDNIIYKNYAKYQHINKEDILYNLNQCIVNPINYQLNTEAFVMSSGNLKHNKIVELIKSININLDEKLKKNEGLMQFIQNKEGITHLENLSPTTLYEKIDDLVERRNIIAHGSFADVDDLLDNQLLLSYIDFTEKYCEAIFDCLMQTVIKQKTLHICHKIEKEKVHNVWRNSILGFEIENYKIKYGDILIIHTNEDRFIEKEIIGIQINKQEYPEISVTDKTDVAVKINGNINKNQSFYLLKK